MNVNSQEARDIVAKNLRKLLIESEKSQADIVRDCNIRQSTVSDYFTAKKYPRPDKMQALADYFGVLKSEIMEDKVFSVAELNLRKDAIEVARAYAAADPKDQLIVRTVLSIESYTMPTHLIPLAAKGDGDSLIRASESALDALDALGDKYRKKQDKTGK